MFLTTCIVLLTTAILLSIAIVIGKVARDKKLQKLVISIEPEVELALQEVSSYYKFSHYLTESERISLDYKYKALKQKLRAVHDSKQLRTSPVHESAERLFLALCNTEKFKSENNRQFIRRELEHNDSFFQTVLKYPLDAQQREAIVSLEDNVLVISSAGSGKTMTTVGKVRYLIDKQGIAPEKILLVTFTRKAADSLSERLGEKSLKCVTFHKLALDIIAEATGQKPTIADSSISALVYHELMDHDPDFKAAVTDYILGSRYRMADLFEYSSREEYIKERQKYGVNSYYKDMDGRTVFCKSDEESRLCDYLGRHGVQFRYEEKYEHVTADKDYRQYCPDFSIYFTDGNGNLQRIYLEHFAIDSQGHCPKWFTSEEEQKYLEGITWKRELHKRYGTVLLETRSADFHSCDVFLKLDRQLRSVGVNIDETSSGAFSRELAQQEHTILDMLSSFNFLLRSKGETLDQLRKETRPRDRDTINGIIIPFVNRYRKLCQEKGVIDFVDAIIKATELCEKDHRPDYDYILVDEFQDISLDRYRFLQSLRRKSPLTKLFCVGDDWQSIYRFAGSDISLFKQFSHYFGYTKECRMETTYRFGNPCVDMSSRFILANPGQKEKTVRPFSSDISTDLKFAPISSNGGMGSEVRKILSAIPENAEVYLLGRYGSDVNSLDGGFSINYGNDGKVTVSCLGRNVTFMTVHQSKGLESDYVILLNCNCGTRGFPSEIADSPVLNYVLSEPDSFEFSEERRVFYVAVTRAKKCTYVLYDPQNPSVFISEFVRGVGKKADNNQSIPENERCPQCHCGRRIQIKKGIAVNGNPYYVFACSNEAFGCDYMETKFVNLNSRRRK